MIICQWLMEYLNFSKLLQKKFDDFKHQVETGSERFTQCEELCKKLLAADTPYSGEILSKEESLRYTCLNLKLIKFY